MMNKKKLKLLISSLVIVMPAVAAIIIKESVKRQMLGAWHFGWIMPVLLVAIHIFLHLVTFRENERVGQNEKIVNITYWSIPVISVYVSALFIALSLGLDNVIGAVLSVSFGATFIVLGNYMPKAVRNRYFGFKVKWTLANDANWAATHRFSGRILVVFGVIMLGCAFLPDVVSIIMLMVLTVLTVVAPLVYSYRFYKKQLADGTATEADYASYPHAESDKKTAKRATVVGIVIVAFVVVLMFVGKLTFTVGEDALEVKTTFGGGMTVEYADIESVEYRPERVGGTRVSGFASSKLLYGWFKNDELGSYTRYTYTDGEAAVIIHTADGIIVLADKTVEDTKAIYDAISDKIMEGIKYD